MAEDQAPQPAAGQPPPDEPRRATQRKRRVVRVLEVLGVVAVAAAALVCWAGLHQIDEGHVGVYYLGGALLPGVYGPGYHVIIPWLTRMEQVQVTVQTDLVRDIPCGTSGGVLIYFDKIEVVNRLRRELAWETIKNYTIHYDRLWIFEKIHSEMNQFCSGHTLHEINIELFDTIDELLAEKLEIDIAVWAPGIELISVRVTKPKLPERRSLPPSPPALA